MKKLILPAFAIIALLAVSCKPKDEVQPEKEKKVLLTGEVTKGIGFSKEVTTNHSYNAQGNRTGTEGKEVRNNTTTNAWNNTYEYNAEGFLTKETSKYNNSTYLLTYEYADGRLAKKTDEANKYSYSYTYNEAGLLAKEEYVVSGQLSAKTEYQYTDGKLSKKVITYSNNSYRTTTYVVNTQGLVEKETTSSTERRYQYDAEGQMMRQEYWEKGKMASYAVYEYDTKKLIPTEVKHKGHPARPEIPGKTVHNTIKTTGYVVDANGVESLNSTSVSEYQYNADGYPILRRLNSEETTYTYQTVNYN